MDKHKNKLLLSRNKKLYPPERKDRDAPRRGKSNLNNRI